MGEEREIEREREFQCETALVPSAQYSAAVPLLDENREELCLDAVCVCVYGCVWGGVMLAGLMHLFKTSFFQRHSAQMMSVSALQQQREEKIKEFPYLREYEGK